MAYRRNDGLTRDLRDWQPKRSRAAWREGAPAWVCDVFDDAREGDRYTVFLTGEGWIGELDPRVPFIGCDGFGRCHLGSIMPHEFTRYRYRNGKRRVAWNALPADIRTAIIDYANAC